MNLNQYVNKIEKFLTKELTSSHPITVLSDSSLLCNGILVKKEKNGLWAIKYPKGEILDQFNLKSSAISAANLYSKKNFKFYNSLKELDSNYFKNKVDADRFHHRYTTTFDTELRDFYIARYTQSKERANNAKAQIMKQFSTLF